MAAHMQTSQCSFVQGATLHLVMYACVLPSQALHAVSGCLCIALYQGSRLAQVMYAYVMRPETLPASYWKFIVKSGPVEAPALEAVRRSIRKLPIDLQAFNAFLKKRGSAALLATAFPKQVQPCPVHGGKGGEGLQMIPSCRL